MGCRYQQAIHSLSEENTTALPAQPYTPQQLVMLERLKDVHPEHTDCLRWSLHSLGWSRTAATHTLNAILPHFFGFKSLCHCWSTSTDLCLFHESFAWFWLRMDEVGFSWWQFEETDLTALGSDRNLPDPTLQCCSHLVQPPVKLNLDHTHWC